MIDSGTVSSSNTGARQNHGELLSKIAEQRVALHNIQSKVEYIESQMEVDGAPAQAKLNAISLKSDATHASMISLRSLAEQFVALCREISHEVREFLQSILRADWRTYQAVLQIQDHLAHSPSSRHDSIIRFTNALGEYRVLIFRVSFSLSEREYLFCYLLNFAMNDGKDNTDFGIGIGITLRVLLSLGGTSAPDLNINHLARH